MKEVEPEHLQRAVEDLHGCAAKLVGAQPVSETFRGRSVWQGIVHIFNLEGHPTASRCYAWSSPIEGTERRRFYAVLHAPPVASPADAVRAAIVADFREKA